MREAQLEAHKQSPPADTDNAPAASAASAASAATMYSFRKRRLLESTSMVHTPIADVEKPDLTSFPKAKDIPYVDCSK